MRDQQSNAPQNKTACSRELHNSINDKQVVEDLKILHSFIGAMQLQVIVEMCHSEERRYIYSTLRALADTVSNMPVTYETDGTDALVHLHYFTASCDWYIVELDIEGDQLQTFGKADLGMGFPELGYINLPEILECGAELDLHWSPRRLSEI